MSLFIASLNSGSNGNCYYVGNQQEAVLVDAGISCREIEKRMSRLGLSLKKVRAVFISHEHSDHIRGVAALSRKYQLPVYITFPTLAYSGLVLDSHLVVPFKHQEAVAIGDLTIIPFLKHHDATDPHSFVVSCNNINVGVFTDLGIVCEELTRHFRKCHAAFLEANYDEAMLENGRYPYHLKRRIRGGKGHLSNSQALKLFIDHRANCLTHLLLSHLSRDNNSPELVHQLFSNHAVKTKVVVASRYEESEVYHITGEHTPAELVNAQLQYALF